ncbi:MAG: 2-vinyl bacteriochlorophyllide hydratase [Caulobacteraceae bacterium]|nr:2-vinyl bacteriochlorophyllide hydratase [Caulobacteraceae bacterium]
MASQAAQTPKMQGSAWSRWLDGRLDSLTSNPWSAHAGYRPLPLGRQATAQPLYSPEERARRDGTVWTVIQGVLAPLQFLALLVSLFLVVRYLWSGEGQAAATLSIIVKTLFLYAIMITGSIWERVVFGKWLFAPAFFWEDVVSMAVLALHTAYLAALAMGWGSPAEQMALALAAYAAYVVNAAQFLWKFRMARLEAPARMTGPPARAHA